MGQGGTEGSRGSAIAQPDDGTGRLLRVVGLASVGSSSNGSSDATGFLATVVVDSQVTSFSTYSNSSALCNSIRNASSPTGPTGVDAGCPYGPGQVAIGLDLSFAHSYPLTTVQTQMRPSFLFTSRAP